MKAQYHDYGKYLMAERTWFPIFKGKLLFNLWHVTLEFYTRYEVRDWSKDKLIAISGIAFPLYKQVQHDARGYFSGCLQARPSNWVPLGEFKEH